MAKLATSSIRVKHSAEMRDAGTWMIRWGNEMNVTRSPVTAVEKLRKANYLQSSVALDQQMINYEVLIDLEISSGKALHQQ